MKRTRQSSPEPIPPRGSHSELLILPDGRILVHNLTPTMAALLRELNPAEDVIRPRTKPSGELQTTRQIIA